MSFVRTILSISALILATGCSSFELLSRERLLDFDFDGTTVKITSDTTNSVVELKPYLDARGDYEYRIFFVNRRESSFYALLNVSGKSQTGESGSCAKGLERNIVWLKLDSSLQPQEVRSVLVESCLKNIDSHDWCTFSGNRLTAHYVSSSVMGDADEIKMKQMQSSLSYDSDHPEAGVSIETHEMKPDDAAEPQKISASGTVL
jgi:hypothetical protein